MPAPRPLSGRSSGRIEEVEVKKHRDVEVLGSSDGPGGRSDTPAGYTKEIWESLHMIVTHAHIDVRQWMVRG